MAAKSFILCFIVYLFLSFYILPISTSSEKHDGDCGANQTSSAGDRATSAEKSSEEKPEMNDATAFFENSTTTDDNNTAAISVPKMMPLPSENSTAENSTFDLQTNASLPTTVSQDNVSISTDNDTDANVYEHPSRLNVKHASRGNRPIPKKVPDVFTYVHGKNGVLESPDVRTVEQVEKELSQTLERARSKRQTNMWAYIFPVSSSVSSPNGKEQFQGARDFLGEAFQPTVEFMNKGVSLLQDLYTTPLQFDPSVLTAAAGNDSNVSEEFEKQLTILQEKIGDLSSQLHNVVESFQNMQVPPFLMDSFPGMPLLPPQTKQSAVQNSHVLIAQQTKLDSVRQNKKNETAKEKATTG